MIEVKRGNFIRIRITANKRDKAQTPFFIESLFLVTKVMTNIKVARLKKLSSDNNESQADVLKILGLQFEQPGDSNIFIYLPQLIKQGYSQNVCVSIF